MRCMDSMVQYCVDIVVNLSAQIKNKEYNFCRYVVRAKVMSVFRMY